jgi:DNA-binding transcriptional MocR family regulator
MILQLDMHLLSDQIKNMIRDAVDAVVLSSGITQNLISKQELAKALNCSVSTVDSLRRDGILRSYKLGPADKAPVRFDLQEAIVDIKNYNEQH